MKKIKKIITISILLVSLFFILAPFNFPENLQFEELLNSADDNDVIIIFNSGGWGNTPLEKADDFTPIIRGIQQTLEEFGYNSLIISYNRTKDGFSGKITGIKDFLNSFQDSSAILAKKVNILAEKFPDKKIIMTGLSAGATFTDRVMEKINSKKTQVYAIAAGIPFWEKSFKTNNILLLNNNSKDALSTGELKSLLLSLIKAPQKWILAKINGQNLTYSRALQIPGHEYFWSSPDVGSKIVNFLENKIR